MVIVKKDQSNVHHNIYCGEIAELLLDSTFPEVSIAMAFNIQPTKAHYHTQFDEIYLVVDGELTITFYEPDTNKKWEENFKSNELCVIGKGVHHQITQASAQNRLCIICHPMWRADDEYPSEVLDHKNP